MSKVLIDRELLERAIYALEREYEPDMLTTRDIAAVLAAPSGTPEMPVKAYYHECNDVEGVRSRSVGLEVRTLYNDAHLVLEADALAQIACLEGEIAKRDEELAACRVAVENCEVFRARIAELEAENTKLRDRISDRNIKLCNANNELSAIKAQESVWRRRAGVMGCKVFMSDKCYQAQSATMKANYERVAPVSEAKAQGVVMPERMKEDANSNLEWSDGWNECLKEVARLNAAPVQQVSVPDGYVRVPIELTDEMLRAMKIQLDKSPVFWCRYRAAYRAMLAAAPAAPAAYAVSVEMVQAACAAFRMDISPMLAMHDALCAALAAHRAKGAV